MPQRGNNNSVELPSQLPKDDYLLKDLEPLGWIKTQALELSHLSPTDITSQAKLMADHPEWGTSSICITAAFTPGSVSLSAHSLSVAGFEWGRKNQDTSPNPPVSTVPYPALRTAHIPCSRSLCIRPRIGFQSQHVRARAAAPIRAYPRDDAGSRGPGMELRHRLDTAVVSQPWLLDDARHASALLGRGAPSGCVLDRESTMSISFPARASANSPFPI